MFIRLNKNIYQHSKSIVVAGTVASGKTHFIKRLKKHITMAQDIDRSSVEMSKIAPADTIIHWPIAEKMNDINMENVGAVIILEKNWEDYSNNMVKRGKLLQYSKLGLEGILSNWRQFFNNRGLPVLKVESNDQNMKNVVIWLLRAFNLILPF
jgi:hypothetical protein